MTLQELNNLRYIDREIQMLKEHIEELRTKAERTTPSVTTYVNQNKETCVLPNMGGAGGGHDRTADMVMAILEEEKQIESLLAKRQAEKQRLMQYISTVPDSLTRQIFILRFIDALTWGQVAKKIGGGNTADSVRMQAMRYID